jgi:hypothetical protein
VSQSLHEWADFISKDNAHHVVPVEPAELYFEIDSLMLSPKQSGGNH